MSFLTFYNCYNQVSESTFSVRRQHHYAVTPLHSFIRNFEILRKFKVYYLYYILYYNIIYNIIVIHLFLRLRRELMKLCNCVMV